MLFLPCVCGATAHYTVLRKYIQAILAGVAFDDEGFVDFVSDFIASRNVLERAFELLRFDANPAREAVLLSQFEGFSDTNLLLGLFAHGDDVTRLDVIRRNIHLLAVDEDSAVRNHLACFSARGAKAHAVNHVVQTGLKEGEKIFTGVAGDTFSFRERRN